jgi:hypothetical protein
MSENNVAQSHSSMSDVPGQRRLSRRARLIGYAAGILLTIGIASLALWIRSETNKNRTVSDVEAPEEVATSMVPLALQRPVVTEEGLVEKSGVQIIYVAVTGGGGLIDLRYQVVDPDKAVAVHDDQNPPIIVDESTGVVVNNLLMGHSHSGPFNAGQTYYLIFENPGNIVQSGSKVSVLLGGAEVDYVVVK